MAILEGIYVTNFSLLYWIAIGALFLGLIGLMILCKKMGKEFTNKLLIFMFAGNFLLHFVKQLIPSYMESWPNTLVRSTAENFCALMVMVSPFFYLSKNKYLRDYLFYMGIISALLAYFFPTSPSKVGLNDFSSVLETTRYYLCHAPIFYGGILMVFTGIHKLSYKRFFVVPFMIFAALGIVWCNCALMNLPLHNFEWSELLSRDNDFMNSSFANGPNTSYDATLGVIYPYLIPFIQTYYVDGVLHFTPVLWMLPMLLLASIPVFLLLCLPFEAKHIASDIKESKQKKRKKDIIEEI